jgi:protein tyrosine/serine phosphatase
VSIWSRIKKAVWGIEDAAGEGYGVLEEAAGRPLYKVDQYEADVDPGRLVRGSWPSRVALASLKARGVRTVVNLCAERSQDADVVAAGMQEVWIRVRDNTVPSELQVEDFLLTVAAAPPVFVHCEQGKGRTGCMVAAYRVRVQGWKPEDALREAENYGLGLPADRRFILGLRATT